VLDWFHITMRITVPGQFIKGLVKLDAKIGGDIERDLESVKWYLRHGNVVQALDWIKDIYMLIWNFEESYPKETAGAVDLGRSASPLANRNENAQSRAGEHVSPVQTSRSNRPTIGPKRREPPEFYAPAIA